MKNINEEQVIFIKTLLEDELGYLNIKRSRSANIKQFDEFFSERMKYIKDLIKELE